MAEQQQQLAQARNVQVAPQSTASKIEGWMQIPQMAARLESALAGYLPARVFAAQCILAAKDPNLHDVPAAEVFAAFLVCAQMGLLPGKHHGHVALIPRRQGNSDAKVVDVMPQWQGYKFLMERQPGIKRVTPVLVHVLDEFAFDGVQVAHRFDPFDERRVFAHPSDLPKDEAPGLRGGYLRIEHDDGEVRFHFVAVSKIEAARKCSQTPDLDRQGRGGVWRKWYAEQATKTVLRDAWARRAVAVEPILSERMGEVVQRDDAALGNDPLRIEVAPRDAEPPEERAPSAAPANKGAAKLRDALRPATIDTTAEPVAEVAP